MNINELAQLPVGKGVQTTDSAILRQAIQAEYDAVNLYEQMARSAKSPKLKELLLDVAQEEKVHIGEFEGFLETIDDEHKPSVKDGKKEMKNFKEWLQEKQPKPETKPPMCADCRDYPAMPGSKYCKGCSWKLGRF